MKKNLRLFITALGLAALAFGSCKKETGVKGATGPQGPQGPSGEAGDTGSITGTVTLYNEYSYSLVTGNADVVVTLVSGGTTVKDTTDTYGFYQFHGLATGTYNLTYQKTGYGTMKVYGVSHIGGGPLATSVQAVDLVQLPDKTAVTGLTGQFSYIYYLFSVTLAVSAADYEQYGANMLLCIGKDATVGPGNNVKSSNEIFIPDGTGAYTGAVSRDDLSGSFQTGDTMYIKAYTFNRYLHITNASGVYTDPGESVYYIDPLTGYPVYPNLSQPVLLKMVYQ